MNIITTFTQLIRRYKTATVLNILGLTVAFASFTIIMTQVKYDLTFDHQYENTDRIFRLETKAQDTNGIYDPDFNRKLGDGLISIPAPDIEKTGLFCENWEDDQRIYDASKDIESAVDNISYGFASRGLLDIFELECVAGNFSRFEEPNIAIISQSTAHAIFGEKNPVGQSLIFSGIENNQPREVIAVYKDRPKNSSFTQGAILFVGNKDTNRDNEWGYTYFVRLSSADNADKITKLMQARCDEIYNNDNYIYRKDISLRLNPIADLHFTTDTNYDDVEKGSRTTVYCLLAVAILIIVIAIINFVNFSVALVPMRIRRINTQRVVGATCTAIRREIISEATAIALFSFLLSIFTVELFSSSTAASLVSTSTKIGTDFPLLLLTGTVALLTGIVAGIYPAFYSTSFQPALVLKGSFGLSNKGHRLRTALISFQYVISIGMIIIAIAIHVQNRFMSNHDMGFQKENILITDVTESVAGQRSALEDKLRSNPDIQDVTFARSPVVTNSKSQWTLRYKNDIPIRFSNYVVAPNFLRFMGLKITEGRDFDASDRFTYIFNNTAQQQYHFKIGDRMQDNGTLIAGIVEDFNFQPMQYKISPIALMVYDDPENPWLLTHVMVKVRPGSAHTIGQVIDFIQKSTKELDPTAKSEVTFMDESIGNLYQKERSLSTMITLFSLISILISVVGVFGLTLFETQHRRKEIGVRKVFGATIREIVMLFNRGFIRIIVACFIVAAPVAYYIVKRWQENFAYQSPISVWIFAAALLAIMLITVATISLQSYKTATENPVKAIRTE